MSADPSYDFVDTGDFMPSSAIENGVCYRVRLMSHII
jgi:hypothetical protein